MALSPPTPGGSFTAPNRAPAAKVLTSALANARVAQSLITALGNWSISAAVVATSVSPTTNFASAQVGDFIVHIPATAGNAAFETVATAGTKPSAAVVGDLYIVLHLINLDSNNPLAGATTGDGGIES